MNSPKLPNIQLQGWFYAFIMSRPEGFDLAAINHGDTFNAVCTDIREGFGGLYVQGQCEPLLLARSVNQQVRILWLSSDQEVLQFALSPQMLEKIKTARQ